MFCNGTPLGCNYCLVPRRFLGFSTVVMAREIISLWTGSLFGKRGKGKGHPFPSLYSRFYFTPSPIHKQRGCLQARSHGRAKKRKFSRWASAFWRFPRTTVETTKRRLERRWVCLWCRVVTCGHFSWHPYVRVIEMNRSSVAWWENYNDITAISRRRRNFYDGFEEGFRRGKSQLVQEIYHSHIQLLLFIVNPFFFIYLVSP